ncbi:MAG: DUF4283 domain-containing protein, partial ['Waltheria sp.' little leaf phytoplasma]|nr:DUF4283 domain-containing protein ['Waltheria sp.' little leaf phytoplasma]
MATNIPTLEPPDNANEEVTSYLDLLELKTNEEMDKKVKKHSLVGRLICDRQVRVGPVRAILSKAWPLSNELEVLDLERNTFWFIFKSALEKRKVLAQGPWSIMGHHLVLKDWPPDKSFDEIDFSTTEFWVQVHNLPPNKKSEENLFRIGSLFKGTVSLDFKESSEASWNVFERVKVVLDVEQPLKSGFLLPRENDRPVKISFKYERLPDFCYSC